jgi:signal transduction histidine kinase
MRDYFAPIGRTITYSRLAYLFLGLPLGIAYFVFLVTALSVAGSLAIFIIGLPLLAASVLAWRALARFERHITTRFLGVAVAEPPDVLAAGGSIYQRTKAVLTDSSTWRSLLWLLLRFPLGIFGFVLAVLATAPVIALIVVPIAMVAAADAGAEIDFATLGPVFWSMPVIGALLAPAAAHIVNGYGVMVGGLARSLLGPTAMQRTAALERRTTVLEERTRLAHELHDSVGHTLTMIVVQAGASRHVFDRDPEFVRHALEHIETGSRQALGELDRILGILRSETEDGDRAPTPDLSRLHVLVDDTTAAGLDLTLNVDGRLDDLPPTVSRVAYRIVQEGLTNVVKHAGAVPTTVTVGRLDDALELEVVNEPGDGNGAPLSEGGGRGLAGIHERVRTLGGRFEAAPLPEGGYRLWAHLPMD